MCSDQSPWAVNDQLAYGFAAVSASNPACCQCYQLTFTSGPVAGKEMIVQATNTGTDVSSTQFDIAVSSRPESNRISSKHFRCPAVDLESSTAALPSGEPRQRSGALNTAVLRLTLALNSHPSFNLAVSSDGDGSRALTTQRKLSSLLRKYNPLIPFLVSTTESFLALLKLPTNQAAL